MLQKATSLNLSNQKGKLYLNGAYPDLRRVLAIGDPIPKGTVGLEYTKYMVSIIDEKNPWACARMRAN